MTIWMRDFSQDTLAQAPAGLTERSGLGGSGTVELAVAPQSDRVLKASDTPAATSIFLSLDAAGTPVDFDMVVLQRADGSVSQAGLRMGPSGRYSANDAWGRAADRDASALEVSAWLSGVFGPTSETLGANQTREFFDFGQWHWVRANMEDDTMRAKWWAWGSEEPAGWQVDRFDTKFGNLPLGYAGWATVTALKTELAYLAVSDDLLVPAPIGAVVSGSYLDDSSNPVVGAGIIVVTNGGKRVVGYGSTDGSGAFSIVCEGVSDGQSVSVLSAGVAGGLNPQIETVTPLAP